MREKYKTKQSERGSNAGFSLIEILIVVTVIAIITAMAIPVFSSILRNLRADGDMRALAGDVALAKMRAAASFSKARVLVDTSARSFQVEVWNKTSNSWVAEGGTQSLSNGVSYGYGSLSVPPPNTQATIGQAPACQSNSETVAGSAGTSTTLKCVVFSSRGIPVDNTGVPITAGALYISDNASVEAITVSATGLIRTWRSPIASANWQKR
jgi:prepilin-type N-terminal cleavage/methylation domain-containing protein